MSFISPCRWRHRFLLAAMFACLTTWHAQAATDVDQSQTSIPTGGDYVSVGQSFVAGKDGSLVGISLPVKALGYSNGPRGSDFTVVLRAFSGAEASGPTLATATVSHTALTPDQTAWVTATFTQPYSQTAGESLCFTITNTSGGGANGYNVHGLSRANPYAAGARISKQVQDANDDLGFETLLFAPDPPKQLPLPAAGTYTGTARGLRSLVPADAPVNDTASTVTYAGMQRVSARLFADGRLHILYGDYPETTLTTGQLGTLVGKLTGAGAYAIVTAAGTVEAITVTPRMLRFTYVAPGSTIEAPDDADSPTLRTRIVFTLTRTGR